MLVIKAEKFFSITFLYSSHASKENASYQRLNEKDISFITFLSSSVVALIMNQNCVYSAGGNLNFDGFNKRKDAHPRILRRIKQTL